MGPVKVFAPDSVKVALVPPVTSPAVPARTDVIVPPPAIVGVVPPRFSVPPLRV